MKYAINVLANIVLCWPALAAGYIVAAICSGFETGRFMYDRHEQAAVKKFCDTGMDQVMRDDPISDAEQSALYSFTAGTPHHDVVRTLYRAAYAAVNSR